MAGLSKIGTVLMALVFTGAASASGLNGDELPTGTFPENDQIVVEGAKLEKPKVICRREAVTGSIMPKTVCRTQAQIAIDLEQAVAAKRAIQDGLDTQRMVQMTREASK